MSADALPITPARFAAALPSLPLSSLHAKAAEIHNSISHLLTSNKELEALSQDPDCAAAIAENEEVLDRMRERLRILKAEVEGRGAVWVWSSLDDLAAGEMKGAADVDALDAQTNGQTTGNAAAAGDSQENGHAPGSGVGEADGTATNVENAQQRSQSGRLTDEELARRMRGRMEELGDDDDGGMHL